MYIDDGSLKKEMGGIWGLKLSLVYIIPNG